MKWISSQVITEVPHRSGCPGGSILLAIVFTAFCAIPALASYREYGTNRVASPRWPIGLEDLVNHPARFAGHSLNGSSEFEFHADTATLNQFVEKYASIHGVQHHVYLIASDEPLDTVRHFELQVLDHGETTATLKVIIGQKNQLEDLTVPPSVSVAGMPTLMQKSGTSAEDSRRREDLEYEIKAFVEKHRPRSP